MQPSDKPQFARILVGLATIKPGAKLTPEALEVWWLALQSWALEEFQKAAGHLASSVEFMPSPFHFAQLRKAGRATAGELWARAVECARRGGGSADPMIETCVGALGGWSVVRFCDEDKLHFLERRFAEHYEQIQDAEDVRESLPQIAGPSRLPKLSGPRPVADLLPFLPHRP